MNTTNHLEDNIPSHQDTIIPWSVYKEITANVTAQFVPLTLELLNLAPFQSLLDVACGMGALAEQAALNNVIVLAIDEDQEMIDHTTQVITPYQHARAAVMDGQSLTLDNNTFDSVASLFGVMHFPDYRRGLTHMYRVLKPTGTTVLSAWTQPYGTSLLTIMVEAIKSVNPHASYPQRPGISALSDPDRVSDLLHSIGFTSIESHCHTRYWEETSLDSAVEKVWQAYMHTDFFQSNVHDTRSYSQLHSLIHDKLQAYEYHDGSIRVPNEALVTRATKP